MTRNSSGGDPIPQEAKTWPQWNTVSYRRYVGKKCGITLIQRDTGNWLASGGLIIPEGWVQEITEFERDALVPAAAGGVDTAQAQLYYRLPGKGQDSEVRVILPDDAPFRATRKGIDRRRTKSYDTEGNPVPQVRLLHALETGNYDDRRRALEAFSMGFWKDETFGEVFDSIEEYASTPEKFHLFVSEQQEKDALTKEGRSNWKLWVNIAERAVEFSRGLMVVNANPNTHALFVRAVRDATVESHGLPSQLNVRERWEKLGGRGDWREIRNTLGFDWIPTQIDWKRYWKPIVQSIITASKHPQA